MIVVVLVMLVSMAIDDCGGWVFVFKMVLVMLVSITKAMGMVDFGNDYIDDGENDNHLLCIYLVS